MLGGKRTVAQLKFRVRLPPARSPSVPKVSDRDACRVGTHMRGEFLDAAAEPRLAVPGVPLDEVRAALSRLRPKEMEAAHLQPQRHVLPVHEE
jgi:hypothetical protein